MWVFVNEVLIGLQVAALLMDDGLVQICRVLVEAAIWWLHEGGPSCHVLVLDLTLCLGDREAVACSFALLVEVEEHGLGVVFDFIHPNRNKYL